MRYTKVTQSEKVMTINLPPIPMLHPAPAHYSSSSSSPTGAVAGQKRTRTLADMRAEVAQKKQRPSVITYCQPRNQPMPVRVIKSVQKVKKIEIIIFEKKRDYFDIFV